MHSDSRRQSGAQPLERDDLSCTIEDLDTVVRLIELANIHLTDPDQRQKTLAFLLASAETEIELARKTVQGVDQ